MARNIKNGLVIRARKNRSYRNLSIKKAGKGLFLCRFLYQMRWIENYFKDNKKKFFRKSYIDAESVELLGGYLQVVDESLLKWMLIINYV